MRWRILFFVSLGANVLLASFWAVSARRSEAALRAYRARVSETQPGKTNVIVRRQFFSWQQLESDDYPTYIGNLRQIGCPEQTIRDIIIADVNGLYARRRATEITNAAQQWWRSEPDPEIVRAAEEKMRELEQERQELLAKLLGPNWETGDLLNLPRPTRPGVILDGPVLGALPLELKQAVEEISARGEQRMRNYLEAQRDAGRPVDPAELGRLRQQTRTELAGVLSPPQLEEFLLRYSQNANNVRAELGQLRFFNATPDEFRAIFRAADGIDEQLQMLAGRNDPNSVAQRNALQQQRENAVKLALGPERFKDYVMLHDPLYRDAVLTAEQSGNPDAAQTLYQINLASLAEQNRIQTNGGLTDQQRQIELKRIELEQLRANAQATGQDVPPDAPPAPTPAPTAAHVIGKGETVATVSLQYGVPISAIKAANPNLDFSQLKPGDTIRIPQSFLAPR